MATKEAPTLGNKYLVYEEPIKKSEEMLKKLKEAADEALSEEKAKEYAEGMKEAAQSVQRSVGSMRRALAGFDELNRMNRLKTYTVQKSKEQLLLEYLNSVDFDRTMSKMQLVRSHITFIDQALSALTEQIYLTNVAMQVQEYAISRHSPAWQSMALDVASMTAALRENVLVCSQLSGHTGTLSSRAAILKTSLSPLQEQLRLLGTQTNTVQLQAQALAVKWDDLRQTAALLSSNLSVLRQKLTTLADSQTNTQLLTGLTGANTVVRQQLNALLAFAQSEFLPRWQSVWGQVAEAARMAGLPSGVRATLNQTVTLFNRFLASITAAFNSFVSQANQMQLYLGRLTGTQTLRLPSLTAPSIPQLARGAVLPANRPFLAVVGDQKHGTNVEAPLSTIQEAVALVMQDYVSANLAGQEAAVAVLRQILEAVLGISIGDDVIGAAAQRYRSKMAVVTGGAL